MRVLITDQLADVATGILSRQAEVDVRLALKPDELRAIIGGYEALIVRSQTKVTADIVEAGQKLLVIGRAGVGIDNIDVDAATRRGILVVNSPEGNITSTAEHTIAMMLAVARHIPRADAQLRGGVWNRQIKGTEIRNKTLGVIGLGRVGAEVAQLARGLRMNVIATDPMVAEARAERLGVRLVDLNTLLGAADFITVHVPLNSDTRGMLGEKELRLLKPSAMLINCARGGIIDEQALYDALEKELVAGAAIDVFSQEPAKDNILFKSDKAVVTPHLAASTVEAEISASRDIAEQVVSVLKGSPPLSAVNAPIVSKEAMLVLGPYLEIGRKIGRIARQLAPGRPEWVTVHYQGDIAKENTEPIKVTVLSGLLEMTTDQRVTIVNADAIARERGLKVSEEKDPAPEHYTNMLAVELAASGEKTLIGASAMRGRTYLTQVNDYWLEIEPSDSYMLFTEHKDRPGMIGSVGRIIGAAGVNISQMQVSRGLQRGEKAMMVLCLDGTLPPECYERVQAIKDMYKAVIVKVGD